MHADEDLVPALLGELHEHAKKLKKRLRSARKGDIEGVHDARTAARRLRLELDILSRHAGATAAIARADEDLRALQKALGRLRDEDVLHEHVRRAQRGSGLADLRKRIEKKRKKKGQQARGALSKGLSLARDLRRFEPRWEDNRNVTGKIRPVLVRHLKAEELARAFDAVVPYEAASSPDHETLHAFRSACRGLRYVLELFEDAPRAAPVIRALRKTQKLLGDLHDEHVAVERIGRWVSAGKVPHSRALEVYLGERMRTDQRLFRASEEQERAILGREFRARFAAILAA